MAIFNRLTNDELLERFQYVGFIHGFVPVYVGRADSMIPLIAVRNGCPDWLLDVGNALWHAFMWAMTTMNPNFEAGYAVRLTGCICEATGYH